jgi:hypothetical protein
MGRKNSQGPYAIKQKLRVGISSIGSHLHYAGDFFRRRRVTLICVTNQQNTWLVPLAVLIKVLHGLEAYINGGPTGNIKDY